MHHIVKRHAAVAASCLALSTGASAGVGFDTADGWKYSTDGWVILQAHKQNGDTADTTGFRMTSGTTPSLIAFNVTAPAIDGMTLSSRVGLYINAQSGEGNFRNAGNVGNTGSKALDPREIWAKLSASWGEVVFGKAYSIYQGEPVLADASVLAGGLTGFDNVNTSNALAATFNAGYMYTNFNAGVRYNSPQDAPVTISLGVYDPSQIRNTFVGSGADRTNSPRVEGGVYLRHQQGDFKVKVYGDFTWQRASHCLTSAGLACADDSVSTRGVSAGATADAGPFNFHLSGFSGRGLGSVLMQDVDSLDAAGRERKSRGMFAQAVYHVTPALSLRYSHGRTRIDDTAVTQGHLAQSNIAGVYYAVNRYLTTYGELANSRFSYNPAFGHRTDTDYATVGVRFMW